MCRIGSDTAPLLIVPKGYGYAANLRVLSTDYANTLRNLKLTLAGVVEDAPRCKLMRGDKNVSGEFLLMDMRLILLGLVIANACSPNICSCEGGCSCHS